MTCNTPIDVATRRGYVGHTKTFAGDVHIKNVHNDGWGADGITTNQHLEIRNRLHPCRARKIFHLVGVSDQ